MPNIIEFAEDEEIKLVLKKYYGTQTKYKFRLCCPTVIDFTNDCLDKIGLKIPKCFEVNMDGVKTYFNTIKIGTKIKYCNMSTGGTMETVYPREINGCFILDINTSEDENINKICFDAIDICVKPKCYSNKLVCIDLTQDNNDIVFAPVIPENMAPSTVSDCYAFDVCDTVNVINGYFTVSAEEGVLANDVDIDGDELSAYLVSNIGDVCNGELNLNQDGSFTYKPNSGFVGCDKFIYYAFDGIDESEPTIVKINVTNSDCSEKVLYEIFEGETVVISDVGEINEQPLNGVLTNSDNEYTYTPNPCFSGTDSFCYTPLDSCEIIKVCVNVKRNFIARDDTIPYIVPFTNTSINVSNNDTACCDGVISYQIVGDPNNVEIIQDSVIQDSNGDFIIYTMNSDPWSFQYEIFCDGVGTGAIGTVYGNTDPPIAETIKIGNIVTGQVYPINITTNESYEHCEITYGVIKYTNVMVVPSTDSNNTFDITPTGGQWSFMYQIFCDGEYTGIIGTVCGDSYTILAIDDDLGITEPGVPINYDVGTNDTYDSTDFTFKVIETNNITTPTILSYTSPTFTITPNAIGTWYFRYQICESGGVISNIATVYGNAQNACDSISLDGVVAGNVSCRVLDFGTGQARFTALDDNDTSPTVNTNNTGIGVSNAQISGGQTIVIDFGTFNTDVACTLISSALRGSFGFSICSLQGGVGEVDIQLFDGSMPVPVDELTINGGAVANPASINDMDIIYVTGTQSFTTIHIKNVAVNNSRFIICNFIGECTT